MTATLTYNARMGNDVYFPSYATSMEATTVLDRLRDWCSSRDRAETLRARSYSELDDTFLECREKDWDGYGGFPVEPSAYYRARCLMASLLDKFPAPAVGGSPHGSITLEWMTGQRRRVMVSIGEEERIAFAAVFGEETLQGVSSFIRDVPREITALLARLYYKG